MSYDKQKVINVALMEVGYLEKKTNANLDSKTENAGSANYTKYARDLAVYPFYNGKKYGVAWCDVFVDWCFVTAYGKDAALALTYQPTNPDNNCGAGCRYSRDYYKSEGRLFKTPQSGDQVFFYNKDKSTISHTGLVYKVDSERVYTIEGNTSGASGVVANGGGVCCKSYKLSYNRIAGYGRPAYEKAVVNAQNSPVVAPEAEAGVYNPNGKKQAANANVVGKTVTITLNTLRRGSKGSQVKALQRILYAMGYDLGVHLVDGDFGSKTEVAVEQFQQSKGLEVDGIVGKNTWQALLK